MVATPKRGPKIRTVFNEIRMVGYDFTRFGSALSGVVSQISNGSPILNMFFGQVESLGTTVMNYAENAFKQATENEMGRIGAAGGIDNALGNKIGFDESLNVFDDVKAQLASAAGRLPGVTEDYVGIYRLVSDDMAGAINNAKLSGGQLAALFKEKIPKAVENLFLNAKLFGQGIPASAVARSYTGFLSNGLIKSKEIFFMRNSQLTSSLKKWEKDNGKKWSQLSLGERFENFNKVLSKTFSVQQLKALNNTMDSKYQSFISSVKDPTTGLFGFERKYKTGKKDAKGKDEETTFFDQISEGPKRFLESLTTVAQYAIKFFDPLQFLGNLVKTRITPVIEDFSLKIEEFITSFTTSGLDENNQPLAVGASIQKRLQDAFKLVFNFDPFTFDWSGLIKNIFDNIIKSIKGIGVVSGKPRTEFEESIDELFKGLLGVVGAIIEKVYEQAAKNPELTFKTIAVLNPGLLLQGITAITTGLFALSTTLILFRPILGWLFGALANVAGGLFAFVGGILGTGALVTGVFIALVAVIVIFRDYFVKLGQDLDAAGKSIGGVFGIFVSYIGGFAEAIGKAGQAVIQIGLGLWDTIAAIASFIFGLFTGKADWDKLMKDIGSSLGKIVGGLWDLVKEVFTAGLKLIVATLAGLISGLMKIIEVVRNFVLSIIPDWLRPKDQNSSSPTNTNQIKSSDYLPGFASGNPFGNLLGSLALEKQKSGFDPVIANSSEAIIPKEKAQSIQNVLTSSTSSAKNFLGNVALTINNYTSTNIEAEVMNALEKAFATV